jgi:hypothetical protein
LIEMPPRLHAGLLALTLAGAAAACGGAPPKGPAWPDPAERRDPEAEDGGESLEPQRSSPVEGDDDGELSDGDGETEYDFEEIDPGDGEGGEGELDEHDGG